MYLPVGRLHVCNRALAFCQPHFYILQTQKLIIRVLCYIPQAKKMMALNYWGVAAVQVIVIARSRVRIDYTAECSNSVVIDSLISLLNLTIFIRGDSLRDAVNNKLSTFL